MKTIHPLNRSDRGSTYMTVMITMIVVGAMLVAYLKMVSVQNQLTMRSQAWNRTVPVLEAGVEEALAHLNKNASPQYGGLNGFNMTADGWTATSDGGWYKIGAIGPDYYYTKITSFTPGTGLWPQVLSTGYVSQVSTLSWNRGGGPFLAALSLDQLLSSKYTKRTVVCTTTNIPTFNKGLLAKHGIDMNGNNVAVDSFDSRNPSYSTNGRYDQSKRRDHGDIASNDTLTNIISICNANIWGHVSTGPLGTVSVGPNGAIGDAAWQNGGNHGIKPGYFTDDMNVQFADVDLPAGSAGWVSMPNSATLPSGDYRVDTVNSSLTIAPNATVRLRVDGNWSYKGNDALTISSNAHLIIYLNCASADMEGNGIVNTTGTSDQCYIYGTTALTSLDIGGNGECTAVVYAPYASVKLHGGGNSYSDFSGALVANNFIFNGHYNVHYDESLGRMGLFRGYILTSWNEK